MEFYPDLTRRQSYRKNSKGHYYSDYREYKQEVIEDCKFRCVYCDITLEEHGGESFHLDHFRPQKHFKDLVKDPHNLVSSCPKCNFLKSDHWPINFPTLSFVDPFQIGRNQKFSIDNNGSISSAISLCAEYQIGLLSLNRPARVQIRRSRIQAKQVKDLLDYLDNEMGGVLKRYSTNPNAEDIRSRLQMCSDLISDLRCLV